MTDTLIASVKLPDTGDVDLSFVVEKHRITQNHYMEYRYVGKSEALCFPTWEEMESVIVARHGAMPSHYAALCALREAK